MSNPFNVYKNFENEVIADKKLKIEGSIVSGLEHIIDFYENRFFNISKINNHIPYLYDMLSSELELINYGIEDIKKFCLGLSIYSDCEEFRLSGLYVSALINNIAKHGDKINLNFHKSSKKIDYVCSFLDKDIEFTLFGNFAQAFGLQMNRGKVIVKGNVAGYVGYEMTGGEITIYGNVGEKVGCFMKGGKISLRRKYKYPLGFLHGGEIYHKGKRIYPK